MEQHLLALIYLFLKCDRQVHFFAILTFLPNTVICKLFDPQHLEFPSSSALIAVCARTDFKSLFQEVITTKPFKLCSEYKETYLRHIFAEKCNKFVQFRHFIRTITGLHIRLRRLMVVCFLRRGMIFFILSENNIFQMSEVF